MGIKQVDLVPLNTTQTSPSSTVGKTVQVRYFQVLRTDTTGTLKLVLPADASIVDFHISGPVSDAATTAVVKIGSTVAATEFVPTADVKGGGTFIRPTVTGTAVDQLENVPLGADKQIWALYAETGTASTVGGPYKVAVYYVR